MVISKCDHHGMSARDLALRHLIALQVVHREGSYRRAAAALGYSQAAITQQVAALERALGTAVFDRPRGPRPVTLTDAGREVLALADEVVPRADLLDTRLRALQQGRWGRLAIGTFQSVSAHLLPGVLAGTRQDEPDVEIHLTESTDNDELVGLLLSGQLDVTFLVGPVTDERLELAVACRDAYVAVLPADRDDEVVALRDLDGTAIIGHDRCACHDTVDRGLQALGVRPTYVFRSNDNAGVQAMVRAGVGFAIMPMLSMSPDDPGIRIVPIDPPLPDRELLIALPASRPSPTAVRFRDRVLAAAAASVPTGPRHSAEPRRRSADGRAAARRPRGR